MKKFIVILSLLFSGTLLFPVQTEAISGADFNAGNIISDAVFFDSNAMTAAQIQTFLETRLPTCDTNGTKIYSGSTTRAQYAATRGISTPFTCMKDYRQDTQERLPESGLCGYLPAKTNQTAAQIIDSVSRACGMSQKVMLVLLQKEQALVTDDWPWPIQYRSATGYGCPDTAPCDAEYYGFYNQVYNAARVYRWYALNNGPNYRAQQDNYVRYSPDASCGGSTIYIENQATAGLYNYTPYQPNAGVLSAPLGQTAACGAYGNKNFWWYYQLWFGSTQATTAPGCKEATNTAVACVWKLRNVSNSDFFYTSSISERDALLGGNNYVFIGTAFFGNVKIAPKPWNVPVYKLTTPSQSSFLTTNIVERDALIVSGYTYNGIDHYADPASSTNSGYPVYRLYSSSLGTHIWTTSVQEKNSLQQAGYASEGIAFLSLSTVNQPKATAAGLKNVYRFSGLTNNSHFLTTDLYERDNMIKSGYKYEGITANSSAAVTAKPIYRLYNTRSKKHLYTTSLNEKNVLDSKADWKYENISQYASDTTTSKTTHRLYSPSLGNHLWTTDAWEKQVLVSSGLFNDEGTAWHQP